MTGPGIERFLERARAHVIDYFEDQCAAMSSAELTEALRHGFERASTYGLETERDLLRYQTMMFVFGRDFDEDPAFPWAIRILRGPGTAAKKMNALQVEALRARSQARGYRPQHAEEG